MASWQAWCRPCGWVGPIRYSRADALADHQEHEDTIRLGVLARQIVDAHLAGLEIPAWMLTDYRHQRERELTQ